MPCAGRWMSVRVHRLQQSAETETSRVARAPCPAGHRCCHDAARLDQTLPSATWLIAPLTHRSPTKYNTCPKRIRFAQSRKKMRLPVENSPLGLLRRGSDDSLDIFGHLYQINASAARKRTDRRKRRLTFWKYRRDNVCTVFQRRSNRGCVFNSRDHI